LLACGVISSVLYVATDLLGGLRYPGYGFTSQAISELGAIGAPSAAFVAPLFTAYGPITLAFAAGVLREAGRNRALRRTGLFLIAYLIIGAGFSIFPISQREAGDPVDPTGHIVVGGLMVLAMLLTVGAGAFALGRRFRRYSLLTMLTLGVSGVLTFLYVPRAAADLPTPGLGIAERINVYSMMLWVSVLAVALLRRSATARRIRSVP
jgi:hypothetical membrane protein